jgi:perosamine synthetase
VEREAAISRCRPELGELELRAVSETLSSGRLASGPQARRFEQECALRLGASHAVACSSGGAALESALRGLGVGAGDEVVLPTLARVPAAMAVRLVGARPVFCDVEERFHALTRESVSAVWSERTRAVVALDMAGVPHDALGLRALCDARGAFLVEDAAHAFGARFPDGTSVGRDGVAHVTVFDFQPSGTITTAEGGLVTCDDAELAERVRRFRSGGVTCDFPGSRGPWDSCATGVGGDHGLSELHAALGLAQLRRLDELLERRAAAAGALAARLHALEGELELPIHPSGSSHNLFIVRLATPDESARRDAVVAHMRSAGVSACVHWPLLHRQPAFAASDPGPGALPVAEGYERAALSLPLHPSLRPEELARIFDALSAALVACPPRGLRTASSGLHRPPVR